MAQINAAAGIDLTKFTFTGNAFQSTGAAIDGVGNGTFKTAKLPGATSGTLTVQAPAIAGTNTLTLPVSTTGSGAMVLATAPVLSAPVVGVGLGAPKYIVNGGNSGNGNGALIEWQHGGALRHVIGNYSTITGGAYDNAMTFFDGGSDYRFYNLNSATVLGTGATGRLTAATTSGTGTVVALATGATLADPIIPGNKVNSAVLNKTDTTFAVVPGLTCALTAGKTYRVSGHLTVTAAPAGGGIKMTLANGDTLTLTSGSFTAANFNAATTNARTTATALGSAVGAATAVVTDVDFSGALVVNAAGTMQVQAAQNAASGTTTVGINSWVSCTRVN